jgi:hypothetical protein
VTGPGVTSPRRVPPCLRLAQSTDLEVALDSVRVHGHHMSTTHHGTHDSLSIPALGAYASLLARGLEQPPGVCPWTTRVTVWRVKRAGRRRGACRCTAASAPRLAGQPHVSSAPRRVRGPLPQCAARLPQRLRRPRVPRRRGPLPAAGRVPLHCDRPAGPSEPAQRRLAAPMRWHRREDSDTTALSLSAARRLSATPGRAQAAAVRPVAPRAVCRVCVACRPFVPGPCAGRACVAFCLSPAQDTRPSPARAWH